VKPVIHRRRSNQIKLILLASVSLTACGPQVYDSRMNYKSREDCVREWGDPALCEQRSHTGTGFIWLGPRFLVNNGFYRYLGPNNQPLNPPANAEIARNNASTRSTGVSTSPRGGFGSSSRSSGGWGG
jgi:hypothetical protein